MHPKHPLSSPQHAPGGGPTHRYTPMNARQQPSMYATATLKRTRRHSQNARSTHDTVGCSGRCSTHPARVSETKLIFCQHSIRGSTRHTPRNIRGTGARVGSNPTGDVFLPPTRGFDPPKSTFFHIFFQTLAPFLNPLFLLFYPILQPSQIAKNNSPTTDRKTTSVQKGYTLYHTQG